MIFKINDKVRILSSGKIGRVCDITTDNGVRYYTVDCYDDVPCACMAAAVFTVPEPDLDFAD